MNRKVKKKPRKRKKESLKVLVVHDEAGNIVGAVIPEEGLEGDVQLSPEPGHYASEVEIDRPARLNPDRFIADIAQRYVVEPQPAKASLLDRKKSLRKRK